MNIPKNFVIVLTKPVKFYLLEDAGKVDIRLKGQWYRDIGFGDWAGFYDWLRSVNGQIIGVRTWLGKPERDLLENDFFSHEAVEAYVDEIRVFFDKSRAFEESISDDQDLGTHRIQRAENGDYLLSYEFQNLPKKDVEDLKRLIMKSEQS